MSDAEFWWSVIAVVWVISVIALLVFGPRIIARAMERDRLRSQAKEPTMADTRSAEEMTNEELEKGIERLRHRLMSSPGGIKSDGDLLRKVVTRLRALPEGERVEGWIDHHEPPDDGLWVSFWNSRDHPGSPRARRAVLILHNPEGED